MRALFCGALVVLTLGSGASAAHGQRAPTTEESRCPAPEGASRSLQASSDLDRFRFISQTLRNERYKARWWNWGWAGLFATGALVNTGFILFSDNRGIRIDNSVALAKSMLGLGSSWVLPLRIARVPPLRGCNDLRAAESALLVTERNEKKGRNWFAHTSAFVVNLGASLYLGFAHDRWQTAIIQGVSGMVISEIKIYTRPYAVPAARARYYQGRVPASTVEWSVLPLGPGGAGLSVVGTF